MSIRDYSRRLSCLKYKMVLFTMQSKLLIFLRLRIMGYFCASCRLISSASSVYLCVCSVHVSVCASVQLEIHSPRNTYKSQMYGYLHGYILFYILHFTVTLYDRNIGLLSLHHAYGSGPIHGIARPMASN